MFLLYIIIIIHIYIYYVTYPNKLTINWTCSYSDVPGNNGKPIKSSAVIQPNDHISIAFVYLYL